MYYMYVLKYVCMNVSKYQNCLLKLFCSLIEKIRNLSSLKKIVFGVMVTFVKTNKFVRFNVKYV